MIRSTRRLGGGEWRVYCSYNHMYSIYIRLYYYYHHYYGYWNFEKETRMRLKYDIIITQVNPANRVLQK